MTAANTPDHGYPTRDVPPDVLSAADMVSIQIERLLAGFPVTLAAMAYRRGRDDAAGGAADISHAALGLTAKAVNRVRPGVEPNTALAVMQALLVLGWRPPPAADALTARNEDAPSGPLSAPVAAETVRVEGIGYPESPAPLRERVRPIKPSRGRTTADDERADVQRRMVMLAKHRPVTAGSDGLGYGACAAGDGLWPCPASRDERKADQA